MPLKRYVASSVAEALSQARRDGGDGALIVSTRNLSPAGHPGRRRGAHRYEVLVAHEGLKEQESSAPAADETLNRDLTDAVQHLRSVPGDVSTPAPVDRDTVNPVSRALHDDLHLTGLSADLVADLVGRVAPRLTVEDARDAAVRRSLLVAALADVFASRAPEMNHPAGRRVMAVVGPPGTGKTTTVGKMALHYRLRRKREVAVICADPAQGAAWAALSELGKNTSIRLETANSADELADALRKVAVAEVILVDTASSGFTAGDPLASLGPLAALPAEAEIYLVIAGTMASRAIRRVVDLYRVLGLTGMILTMLDAGLPLGETLESLLGQGLPVAFLCHGAHVGDGLEIASAHRMAALVLQSAPLGEQRQ